MMSASAVASLTMRTATRLVPLGGATILLQAGLRAFALSPSARGLAGNRSAIGNFSGLRPTRPQRAQHKEEEEEETRKAHHSAAGSRWDVETREPKETALDKESDVSFPLSGNDSTVTASLFSSAEPHESSSSSLSPASTRTISQLPNSSSAPLANNKSATSEIQNAQVIFNTVWKRVEIESGGVENLRFPNEIIWLNGSPGSGKGTNSPFILRVRGITNPPICMSSLLDTPEMRATISEGDMIADTEVMYILLKALLKADPNVGVLVDGFPRTEMQVELLKHFYDKLIDLHQNFFPTSLREHFRRPCFRIAVLFVEESESVRRQLERGRRAKEHNLKALSDRDRVEERVTDFNAATALKRFQIFRNHFNALVKLSELFPFHLINASGSVEEVRNLIEQELTYQSSLELDRETYNSMYPIPIASSIAVHARQDLIRRLDGYQQYRPEVFRKAIDIVASELIPVIRRHAISGRAVVRSFDPIFHENSIAIDMVIDILSERGFHVTYDSKVNYIPVRVDPQTFEIISRQERISYFNIEFQKHHLRGAAPGPASR